MASLLGRRRSLRRLERSESVLSGSRSDAYEALTCFSSYRSSCHRTRRFNEIGDAV